jgi:prevent-host-death family protein
MSLRHIQSSEAKTHLLKLLNDVERGETIVLTRRGRAIARLVPEAATKAEEVGCAIDDIMKFRETAPRVPLEDILSARREGHK